MQYDSHFIVGFKLCLYSGMEGVSYCQNSVVFNNLVVLMGIKIIICRISSLFSVSEIRSAAALQMCEVLETLIGNTRKIL
jgi:hypothetical protein